MPVPLDIKLTIRHNIAALAFYRAKTSSCPIAVQPTAQTPPDRATVIVVTDRIISSTDEGTAIGFNDDYDITAPLKI